MSNWSPKFKKDLRELQARQDILKQPFFVRGHPLVDALFQTGQARSAMNRARREGPIEITEGHWSTDFDTLRLKDVLSRNATEMFPESVDDQGRPFGNSVRGNFYSIRHVNGFNMKNGNWPLVDNNGLRESNKLVNSFSKPWHEKIFRAFVRNFFSDLVIQPLKWRSGSSTAIPEFTTSDARKGVLALEAMKDAQFAGQMMIDGKHAEAFTVYGIGGAYYVVYRSQSTDRVEIDENGHFKFADRMVGDIKHALTGGVIGDRFVSDKDATGIVDQFGDPIDVMNGFARERLRTATAVPGKIGFALMPVAQAVRKCMYEKASFSFHHGSRASMQKKLREWSMAIAVDVSDHDIMWLAFILEIWKDELLNMGYSDWWVEMFITSMKLPIYVGAPAEGEGGVLLGDWRKPDLNPGLPSGNPFTDIFGAGGMSPIYFIIQAEYTAPQHVKYLENANQDEVDRFFLSYLRGELDYSCMSKGDDALMLWRSKDLDPAKALKQNMLDDVQVSDYMKISYEHGEAFLGSLLLYDNTFDLKNVTLVGNIQSLARNMWSPEYGIESEKKDRSSRKRPYPGLAWGSINEVYGTIPIYGEFLELMEKSYFDVFRESHSAYRRRLFDRDTDLLAKDLRNSSVPRDLGFSDLNAAEKDVLNDPQKIHYRYDPEQIRPEILGLLMHGINSVEVEDYVLSIAGKQNIIGSVVSGSKFK